MSWASSRRTLIIVIFFSFIAAVAAIILVATLYETPSCSDGKQNQDEAGIDCGGGCSKVCSFEALPPIVSFVREVKGLNGRSDIVAYVENPNPTAGVKNASFTLELYGSDRNLVAKKTGTTDLPPAEGVPLFFSNVYSGTTPVAQVFLEFDEASLNWLTVEEERIVPRVGDITQGGTEAMPRVTAQLRNPSVEAIEDVRVVAIVYDAAGKVIAGSQTVVPTIPSQGSAQALFTWSIPFTATPSRIEVRPVVPLP